MAPTALPELSIASNEDPRPDRHSVLVIHNVNIQGRRTSIRLEPQIWDTLSEICRREFCTPHDVCSYVAERKVPHGSLTSSLRIFILDYFRTSATEDGHRRAGHGQGMFLVQQHERLEMRKHKPDVLDR
jgi:predicted DNA-binding ribbon-helix-helix protein